MLTRSKFSAIQEIRRWNNEDVLAVLNKNGLGECCDVFKKREIEGEELLDLTEGKLSLWKREINQSKIRTLAAFIEDLKLFPEKYTLKDSSNNETKDISVKSIPPHSTSCSSFSDNGSWDTDFDDDEEEKQKHAKHPIVKKTLPLENDDETSANCKDTSPEAMVKPPDNVPSSTRPKGLIVNGSDFEEKEHLPKPPNNSSEIVKNIISNVNVGAIEAKIIAEQLEEDYYESFDGENIADVGAVLKAMESQNIEQKSSPSSNNHSPALSQTDITIVDPLQSKNDIVNINPLLQVYQHPCIHINNGKSPEPAHKESPPTPPPRNAPMKFSDTDILISRLHSSVMSLNEGTLHRRNNSDQVNSAESLYGSCQTSTTSLSSLNFPIANSSYLHSSRNSQTLSESFSEEEYESLDNRSRVPFSDMKTAISVDYESIKEQRILRVCSDDDYYLQPDPKPPVLPPKNTGSSPEDSPIVLPKCKQSLPDVVVPSVPPPSPPRKKSEDSSGSTTSGSGDSMSGRLGGLLRKVINRPPPLPPDNKEKTPTPTSDLKKSTPLPPPKTRPPPPIDQRPSTFQRPLPPTPEGKKLQLPSPDRSHSAVLLRPTKVSFKQMPWFHSIDRRRAEEILRNTEDGNFVVRPSTQTQNPLTLTLWYKNRVFNISIRHRPDGKYALGTEKTNELSFSSVEELVENYQSEKLVLYSAGERAGKVLLTDSPRRDS